MQRDLRRFGVFVAVLVMATVAWAGQIQADDHVATCPITGKPINKDVSIDYKGGKLYFCCPACVAKFQAEKEKYAPWANYQLVITEQAQQVSCPFTGRPINPNIATEMVAQVSIRFCCTGCKNTVARTTDPKDRFTLVFGAPFDTGFVVKKKQK